MELKRVDRHRFCVMLLPWMRRGPNEVRVGDVLRSGSGDLRVVRGVSWVGKRRRKGAQARRENTLASVTFAIRRCSWTGRGITTLTYLDLIYRGFTHIGARTRVAQSDIDVLILQEAAHTLPRGAPTCCDVMGLP